MTTTVLARDFYQALRKGGKLIAENKRATWPIAKTVLLTKNGALRIASSDFDKKWTETTVYAGGVDEWEIAAPYEPLCGWLAVWGFKQGEELTLNSIPRMATLEVVYGRNRATFKGFDAAEFPARPDPGMIDFQLPQPTETKPKRKREDIRREAAIRSMAKSLIKAHKYARETAKEADSARGTYLFISKQWAELPERLAEARTELAECVTLAEVANGKLTKPLESYARVRRDWGKFQDEKAQAANLANRNMAYVTETLARLENELEAGQTTYTGESLRVMELEKQEAVNADANREELVRVYCQAVGLDPDMHITAILKHAQGTGGV